MKRIFALILVLALAIGCFAGCGEDKKDSKNEGNKDVASSEKTEVMSFNEISETVSKLAKGSEIDIKLSVAVKPVFDETFTESDFLAQVNGLLSKNSNGLYEIPLNIKGNISDSAADLKLKLAEREVSDIIVVEEKAYINVKSVFNFFISFAGVELAWPCENDYIELVSFVEYIQNMMAQQMPNEDFAGDIEWSDEGDFFAEDSAVSLGGIAGIDEETMQQIMDVIEVIKTAIPETTLNSMLNQILNIMESNKVLSKQEDHISIKLDKTNIKGFALALAGVARANGADLIDLVMQAIKNSDKFDEEMKENMTSGYDKEEVKKELEEMLNETELSESLDSFVSEIGDTHLNITMGANDTTATFLIDILLDGLATEETNEETIEYDEWEDYEEESEPAISQVAIVFEVNCAVKEISEIKAPTKVLTEAEINTLFALLS